jgi:dimethylglycine dehydrogenase
MRWFTDHLQDGVHIRELGKHVYAFGLAGPKSIELIENLSEQDIVELELWVLVSSTYSWTRAPVTRMSVNEELGYQINCHYGDHIALRRILQNACVSEGIRECGFNATLSARMEKRIGI